MCQAYEGEKMFLIAQEQRELREEIKRRLAEDRRPMREFAEQALEMLLDRRDRRKAPPSA